MEIINGIKTNLNGNYSFNDGNGTKTGIMHIQKFGESANEMFERLSKDYHYKRITFYYTTTCVRGYYEKIAMCY